jgi:hypothetical protein
MQSKVTFFKNGKKIGWGRWDGRANVRTAPENINWDFQNLDFDEAVCETKGGKRLTIKKKENYGRKDSLDQLSDDFNRKTAEQFKDILFKIDIINSELRKSLIIKEVD